MLRHDRGKGLRGTLARDGQDKPAAAPAKKFYKTVPISYDMGHYDPKEKGKGMFGDLPCAVLAHELLNPGRAGRSPRPWSFYALVTALTAVIIIGGLDLAVHLGQHEYDDHSGFSVAPRKGLLGRCNSNTLRQWAPGDHFGTIFHLELQMFYNQLETQSDADKLAVTLQRMQETGIKTVVFSISWEYGQPEQRVTRYAYLDMMMQTVCKKSDLKAALIVDMLNAPHWLWQIHPDARPLDSDGRSYPRLSMYHQGANNLALSFLSEVSTHLARQYPGCFTAVQPVYNNEYEAKYTQEYDAFQDYSPNAVLAYRAWLRARQPSLPALNTRWSTAFATWDEVVPPALRSGDFMGMDFSPRYWDWIRFREVFGAEAFNRACATVKAAGLQCFHHFPEFFSVIDAIYSAGMFKHIAASPYTDFVILDSNFMTPYGTLMNFAKLRLYVSAGLPYGKPVYFEAAVERYKDMGVLEGGFMNAMLAGSNNLGITNWHTRVDMNASLARAMAAVPQCKACELVGLFIHLDSCAGFHGLQWQWSRRDPLHDFVEALAERLTERCETDVAVYVELDRLLADMHKFDRVVFVEPVVLYGSREFSSYLKVKGALGHVPHEVLSLPINVTTGPQIMVMQELEALA